MKLASAFKYMNKDIQQVERQIREVTNAENSMIQSASNHLLNAGGKRIRPIFVLLSSKFGDVNQDKIINVAVALELIHMASLVHDDVIDHAMVRRGKPTVNKQWDNGTAVFTGDYIFARTLELLKPFKNNRLHTVLSNTIHELCIGEIEQIRDKYDVEQSFLTYFRRIKRKTALLIASSTQMGAIAANVDRATENMLNRYGYFIGMSYQIIDDILDFTSSEKELGKPVGSDLLNGHITLPTLFALENSNVKQAINDFFLSDYADTQYIYDVIQTIKHSHAIERAYQVSQQYLEKALALVDGLPNIEEKRLLKQVALYLGERKF
ncbi:polyprenyl synthetase family protein [Tenuibacillus multivorans]|uniref:Heptaprenyl diphosphate synthase component 2 n=1 Tax=Tenuibacillus multivorans TaxID=237069 RepID=A0A1H0CUW2_9BACI|nr:polyprenyl synthetase family protein [Tenuibacillus multivorans]GEL76154.1 heptaprenyl diphosphate synthase component II [Tenuibacillus multivorans]SDN61672.1 heptaprenyl diphosphate synthase [Tenuibacillus multivorans]